MVCEITKFFINFVMVMVEVGMLMEKGGRGGC